MRMRSSCCGRETSVESAWVQDEAAEGRDSGRLVPGDARRRQAAARLSAVPVDRFRHVERAGDPPDALRRSACAIAKIAAPDAAASPDSRAVTRRPKAAAASVCVLPFVNMSGDPEQEYFSDGITEDIITDLSKVSALSVVARNTAFTFKGQAIDVKDVAREARRQPRARRQRPQGRQPGADHRPADRRRKRRPSSGPSATTAT